MELVKRNQKLHNPNSPLLIGDVKWGDVVNEVNEPSYIDMQQRYMSTVPIRTRRGNCASERSPMKMATRASTIRMREEHLKVLILMATEFTKTAHS